MAFVAIALGIGVNTTILGIVNTLLLRPLPIGHSDRVVQVFTTDTHFVGRSPNSYLNFLDYQKQNGVFSGMAAHSFAGVGMTRGGETSNVLGQLVSGNYFDLLELRPFLGRGFLPEEDTSPNGHPVAVLNRGGATGFYWHRYRRGAGSLDATGDARMDPAFRG